MRNFEERNQTLSDRISKIQILRKKLPINSDKNENYDPKQYCECCSHDIQLQYIYIQLKVDQNVQQIETRRRALTVLSG